MTVANIATGNQALASDVKILGKSKIITASRTGGDASGDVAYTGVGFKPRTIIALAYDSVNRGASIGVADENLAEQDLRFGLDTTGDNFRTTRGEATLISILEVNSTTAFQKAVLFTLDADGFTLTWTKGGAGANTATLVFLCLG